MPFPPPRHELGSAQVTRAPSPRWTTDIPSAATVMGSLREALSAGHSTQVFVVGAPGTGKTTVLDLVDRRLPDCWVLRATADELSADRAHAVIRRLLASSSSPRPVPGSTAPAPAESYHRALRTECSRGPTAVLVDDAHLADPESLALLHGLLLEGGDAALLLVLAFAPLPIRQALVRLRASAPSAVTVSLAPFATAGAGIDESLAARAYLALLDVPTRELVTIVALAGQPVTVDQLSHVRRQAPHTLGESIDSALASGVLAYTPDGALDCAADVYRRACVDLLSPGLRSLVHGAIADGLEHCGVSRERVESHRAAAAADIVTRNAVSVPSQGMFDPAELAGRHDDPRLARVVVLTESGRFRDAAREAGELIGSASEPSVRITLGFALLAEAIFSADASRCGRWIDELTSHDLPPEATEWLRLLPEWLALLSGSGAGSGPAAREHRPAPDTADLAGFTLDTIVPGIAAVLAGRCVHGLEIFDRGGVRNPPDGWFHPPRQFQDVWSRWAAHVSYGPTAALARQAFVAESGTTMVDLWLIPFHHSVDAEILYSLGRFDDCSRAAESALDAAARADWRWTSVATATAALLRIHRDDLDGADVLLAGGGDDTPDMFGFPDLAFATAEALSARGRHLDAVAVVAPAWSDAVDADLAPWLFRRGPHVMRLALQAALVPDEVAAEGAAEAAAPHDAAAQLADHVAKTLEALPTRQCPALAPAAALVSAMRRGDAVAAAESARAYGAVGDAIGELAALEEAACLAAAGERPDVARVHADRAVELARSMGSPTVAERLHSRLRHSGLRLGATGERAATTTFGWDSLTTAERRVAQLVAAGHSGPQIADRLGNSPRTVQTHVSHALAKLGLTSRVQLATEALRHDDHQG